MARYLVIALNGPTESEGDETRYNEWYDGTHLPDLLKVGGIVSGRRFKVLQGNVPWPYAAVYEIETEDLSAVMAEMSTTLSSFPPEFDRSKSANLVAIEITGG